jgi:hypothetical protein
MPEGAVRHRFMMGMTLFKVELREFEPLTSAVQRQLLNVAVVRRCSKIPANKHILSCGLSWMFAVVRLAWCQVGVNYSHQRLFTRRSIFCRTCRIRLCMR